MFSGQRFAIFAMFYQPTSTSRSLQDFTFIIFPVQQYACPGCAVTPKVSWHQQWPGHLAEEAGWGRQLYSRLMELGSLVAGPGRENWRVMASVSGRRACRLLSEWPDQFLSWVYTRHCPCHWCCQQPCKQLQPLQLPQTEYFIMSLIPSQPLTKHITRSH